MIYRVLIEYTLIKESVKEKHQRLQYVDFVFNRISCMNHNS